MLSRTHVRRELGRQEMADYRAGVVWAAVINSQGGIRTNPDDNDSETRAVVPQEMFPSLVKRLGPPPDGAESSDDTDALIAALKRRYRAVDKREKPDGD